MVEIPLPLSRYETVAAALRSLGGQARPVEIAEEIRWLFPGPHTNNLLQSVRARIQECSSDSQHWKKKRDLFYSVHGIGGGVWGLRDMDALNPANRDGFTLQPKAQPRCVHTYAVNDPNRSSSASRSN